MTGRTPCGDKPERTTPARSPFGARMHWPEPAHTEQSLAPEGAQTKGGAVRTRIALATALAVTLIPTLFLTLFTSGTASGRVADGTTTHHAATAGIRVMSYADAVKASRLAAYTAAVSAAQQQQYLAALSYVAYVAANTMPAAWQATAMCEEGGRDDPNYGYFGIKAWNGFGGYPRAGSAPLSVQLAWEAAHGQGPPDAPGRCHAY